MRRQWIVLSGIVVYLLLPFTALGDVFDVRDYGAAGDKKSLDTRAIQAAIDACAKAGGGTVCVPKGDYLSGTIRLASKVTLQLDEGATLWQSRRSDDYPHGRHLLVGQRTLLYVSLSRLTILPSSNESGEVGSAWKG